MHQKRRNLLGLGNLKGSAHTHFDRDATAGRCAAAALTEGKGREEKSKRGCRGGVARLVRRGLASLTVWCALASGQDASKVSPGLTHVNVVEVMTKWALDTHRHRHTDTLTHRQRQPDLPLAQSFDFQPSPVVDVCPHYCCCCYCG